MNIWTVYAYYPDVGTRTTYDGKGSAAHTSFREFDDEPSAHRYALNLAETTSAIVEVIPSKEVTRD